MAKKKLQIEDLPETVFVYKEEDGDSSFYLCASEDYDRLDNGTVVGVYTLVRVARVDVGVTLEAI